MPASMRGQWKGTNEGVVLGSGMYHREGGKAAEPRTVNKEFTLDIKGQDGRRFWGEIVSKDDTGPLLGVIASDKQTIYYIDNTGGHVTGKLIGSGRFEICYLRPSKETMSTSCPKRQVPPASPRRTSECAASNNPALTMARNGDRASGRARLNSPSTIRSF